MMPTKEHQENLSWRVTCYAVPFPGWKCQERFFLFNSNLFLHALFPKYRVDLLACCITQKGITQQSCQERSECLSHGGKTAGKIFDASVRWHTKNPQVCRLLTTITVSVMTPAHSVNFLPSDLFTSAFFISACCRWIAYSQNCASWNITNISSHFLQRGKKTNPEITFWISLCLCQALGAVWASVKQPINNFYSALKQLFSCWGPQVGDKCL